MSIQINGVEEEKYFRFLQHMTDIFYEDKKITFKEEADCAFAIHFQIKQTEEVIHVAGTALFLREEKSAIKHEKIYLLDEEDNRERRLRQTIAHVFLLILQEITQIVPPWGILTGIRPTKLLHQKLRDGTAQEVVHEKLRSFYLISEDKIALMQKIVDRQLQVIPDFYELKEEVSLYIGIPFCPTKCAYCTFPAYAISGQQGSVPLFLQQLHKEIEEIGRWLTENKVGVTTIYFGGGTPTSINADEMDALYEKIATAIPDFKKVREITVEAGRPDTITVEKLKVLKKWQIDRISINPQTYTDETLRAIGRHHTVEETINTFHLAREQGMNNVNMDLILGLPGERLQEVQHSLKETGVLHPESITVHTLAYKTASQMTRNKEKYPVATASEINAMMKETERWMAANEYEVYYLYRQKNILGNLENVGYALRGKESLYNIIIMEEQQTIIGLGCGASSKFIDTKTGKIKRYANPKEPRAYINNTKKYIEEKQAILKEIYPSLKI